MISGDRETEVTVRVDPRLCRGTGLCQAMSPALFRLTMIGHAEAVEARLTSPEALETARSVADCCPMGAIELTVGPSTGGSDRPER
ncbi:ferredoxin [Micromonospora sp. WMMD730]|uniref:ferredoxin n=1 Tax=Micromonospora sp. WMMD730 TaxID=3404128 RepID=UPI003B93090E